MQYAHQCNNLSPCIVRCVCREERRHGSRIALRCSEHERCVTNLRHQACKSPPADQRRIRVKGCKEMESEAEEETSSGSSQQRVKKKTDRACFRTGCMNTAPHTMCARARTHIRICRNPSKHATRAATVPTPCGTSSAASIHARASSSRDTMEAWPAEEAFMRHVSPR